jgi:ankyrin repeat protein
MSIRRLTPKQVLLALGISAVLIGGVALSLIVLDQRAKSALTIEDVCTAVGQGDMTRVIECLKAQPRLASARDSKGRTPLHVAAERNMGDTARLLLNMGADPGQKNSEGKTAVEVAREKKSESVIRVLEGR